MQTLEELQSSYLKLFSSPVGRDVLEDLNIFCHGTKTTAGHPESIERLEGRREVFLRIMSFLKVNFNDVYDLYVETDDF